MTCSSLPSFPSESRRANDPVLFLAVVLFTTSAVACRSTPASRGTGGAIAAGGANVSSGVSGTGSSIGTGGSMDTGGSAATGGSNSTGGANATGGVNATGGTTATGGVTPTGGAVATGGTNTTGGSTDAGGTDTTGGATPTGGSIATGGAAATGGTNATGGAGTSGTGGSTSGSGGTTATGGTATSTGNGACPADAFFCSGFEDTALPAKATYASNLPTPVEVVVDATVHNTGTRSLKVNPGTGYVYRMLSVPAATTFWFRAYMMSDVPIDQKATVHESFMGANWGQDKGVDIVQEQCEVAVNINDNPVLGSNGQNPPITCPTGGQKIAANTWYCFEGSFDGAAGNLEIFVNGASIIKGSAVPQAKQSFTNFRFGYVEYNGTNRTVWYDDVATAPGRIGCLN